MDLIFHATYIASKVGKTGLTVTVDVDKILRSDGTRTAVATAASATEGRNGHYWYRVASVTDLVTYDYVACFKTSDATVDTQHLHSGWMDFPTAYDTQLGYPTGDAFARLGAPAGASVSADVAAIKTDTGNLVTRITSGLFTGITSLAQWLGLIMGKQTGNSTARTEVRATGAGSGTYDETTDSLQAIVDTGIDVTVTLTPAQSDEVVAAEQGVDISIRRHVDYAKTLTGMTIDANWTKMYVTMKRDLKEEDGSAVLQWMVSNPAVSGSDGITVLNQAAGGANRTKGSATVNQGAGTIALTLLRDVTSLVRPPSDFKLSNYQYDVVQFVGTAKTQLKNGKGATSDAATQATS